uniref:Uncharacterized protein n=1 Tax=Siphoviridae sp. ctJ3t72 TaxID=2826240 RepID=A0A8S5QPB5_9CAUD|nr:MAG TPA: hypothetical protein [Siphoviridae sp. ctJ3t72]
MYPLYGECGVNILNKHRSTIDEFLSTHRPKSN